ncbi:MAG TPA: hypothetical protein VIH09_08640 [Flavobacterium sp.]|uniref:hypothetical protein n=1 Tax=Flavobacterium sp. TaxID=239 RepID=UPI002F40495C
MNSNKKIDKIAVENDRLHVFYKAGAKNEILFSELKDIFITAKKIKPHYEFLLIMFSAVITLFTIFYLQASLSLFILSLLMVFLIAKMNNFKRFEITINLKNGISIKKTVPLKLKNETVNFVNDVRKKVYYNEVEISNKIH